MSEHGATTASRVEFSRPVVTLLAHPLPVQPTDVELQLVGSARQKLRLTHRELLGSGPARAQGTRLSRPQAEHLEQARSYHGIESRIFEASGRVTRSRAAGTARA